MLHESLISLALLNPFRYRKAVTEQYLQLCGTGEWDTGLQQRG